MIDERTMQARLFKSFQHYPDQVAIEYQGKTITYGLLDQYSQAVALFLLDMEIPKETFIALAVQDKITLITLIIGILKAGCVFVPLDLNYPEKRTEAMVLASQTPYIMTDENHLAFFLRVRRNMPHRVDIITLHETFYRSTGTLNLQHYADLYRLSAAEQTRYKRQILMDGWGMDGQEKLKSTTVFVAGAGGSGSPLIEQLALCGFGTIIICDYDTVELSNLNRQSLHDESRIGKNKALSAQETVARLNPHVRVLARTEKITADNVFDLVGDAQIIFDNVDSLETKCILSKCAVAKGIPHTISSMIHMGAYACVFHTPFTPCFFCLYDAQKIADIHHAQEIQGTYQVIPNSVASPALFLSTGFVVNEAIKIILKMGQPAYNKYLYFNQYGSEEVLQTKGYWQITYPFNQHFRELSRAQGFDWDKGWHGRFLEEINITPDPHCPLCAQHHTHTTTTTSKTNPPVMPLPEIPYLPQDKINIYFTSGTTGLPKAVVGKNSGMTHFIAWESQQFKLNETSRVSQLTSPCHDPFLRDIFVPLCVGGTLCIPPDRETILNTDAIHHWLEQSRVNLIHCTPGLFKIFSGVSTDCFPDLRYVLLAGEKIVPHDLENWYQHIGARVQLVNIYGPTETTLAKLFYLIQPEDVARETIPIGSPIPGAKVIILNKEQKICRPNEVGEIYIRTPFMSHGYFNEPVLNHQKFIQNPFSTVPGDVIYKTGDLGKMNLDGHIEFMGREDRQVKIRGFRVELDEIEKRLREFPQLEEAVVLYRATASGNYILCAYYCGQVAVHELKEYLEQHLPDYMVPAFYIPMERFPLNVNGKINYQALPEPNTITRDNHVAPRNEQEQKIALIWTAILGIKNMSVFDGFLDMGGNSLNAMVLTSRLYREFQVNFQLAEIFANPTIASMAAKIATAAPAAYETIPPAELREYYPLSSAQRRMYLLTQLSGRENTVYNQPKPMMLRGQLDVTGLTAAFQQLLMRHETLRTSFTEIHGEPVQRIHQEVTFHLESIPVGEKGGLARFIRPFDLSRTPLVRVGLQTVAKDEYILIFDIHHIISDGFTTAIFIEEFLHLYQGQALPVLTVQYKDYAVWQQQLLFSGVLEKQREYWLGCFQETPSPLNLTTDYPRPSALSFAGAQRHFDLPTTLISQLETIAKTQGVTLYMLFLAAFTTLLQRYTGQEDIVVGSPVAGRNHPELERIPGVFINTLAMRNYPQATKPFQLFLTEVAEHARHAYLNQDYPFEEIVEKLHLPRHLNRNPLFDVMLIFQNIHQAPVHLEKLTITPYPVETHTTKFDISLIILETANGYRFSWEYSTQLFSLDTIQRYSSHWLMLLTALSEDIQQPLGAINLLSEEERQQVLFTFNHTTVEEVGHESIAHWFTEVSSRYTQEIALIFQQETLTYGQLDQWANRLAALLREKGVKPDDIVALSVTRSFATVVGIWGIIKAGAAYLPIDPLYPDERKHYMLRESQVSIMVTQSDLTQKNPSCLLVYLDKLDETEIPPVLPVNRGSDLLYCMYTSGSTGQPKGVLLEHRHLANVILFNLFHTSIDFSCVLQFTTISFDVSFQEIWGTLLAGGRLVLPGEEVRTDIPQLFQLIRAHEVRTLFLAASFLKFVMSEVLFLERFPGSVKHIVSAGEQVFLSARFKQCLVAQQVSFHNHYGPTEAHVVTAQTWAPGSVLPDLPGIGKPVVNTRIYILGTTGHVQPIGIPGEIFIAGAQVGRGYLNNSALSAAKFVSHLALPGLGPQRMYRTGDLGRWLNDGSLQFLGRMDRQLKIKGFRIEPEEIEILLLEMDEIQEAVVLDVINPKGETLLCAYIVARVPLALENLKDKLAQRLPHYMIPSYVVKLERLPLTPNGKVNRQLLPPPGLNAENLYQAPTNAIESKLLAIWAEVLKINQENISIDGDFFSLGGHSLSATLLLSRIHHELQTHLPLTELFKTPTIRGLAQRIANTRHEQATLILPAELKEYYPLSFQQKRLWIIQTLEPHNISYHMPMHLLFAERLDKTVLKQTLATLMARHDILRTRFIEAQGTPVQMVDSEAAVPLNYCDLSNLETPAQDELRQIIYKEITQMRFELARAPLFRVMALLLSPDAFELILVMHHIIFDGWSMAILRQEFLEYYHTLSTGALVTPAPLRLQYKDFAQWENQRLQQADFQEAARRFWSEKLHKGFPYLALPVDHAAESANSGGVIYTSQVPVAIYKQLKAVQELNHTTLSMVMFTVFNVLLAHLAHQEEVVCALISAGRDHQAWQSMVGYFTTSILVNTQVSAEDDFNELLARVHSEVMESFSFQPYPLELILEELHLAYPQVRVAFNMLNMPGTTQTSNAQHHEMVQGVKFDLVLFVTENPDFIHLQWNYRKGLFKPTTIESIARLYGELLDRLTE